MTPSIPTNDIVEVTHWANMWDKDWLHSFHLEVNYHDGNTNLPTFALLSETNKFIC